jgi:putative transcriptional regulator
MNSYQGHFLVAAPHEHDPNFVEAVVLVIDHTERGAFGVIVNGGSEERVCCKQLDLKKRVFERIRLLFGGPVTGPLMAVHTKALFGERQFLPGVFFSSKQSNVSALIWRREQPCKLLIGYAGWGPGQLEYEADQGIWRIVPATREQIFSDDSRLWKQLSSQAYKMQLRRVFNIKHIPADPLLN